MRHVILAVGLLVVAGLRLTGGDALWAGILGAAALVETGMAARELRAPRRPASRPPWTEPRTPPTTASASAAALARSLTGHQRMLRVWLLALCLSTVTAVAVLTSAPAIAAVLAVVALVCLRRVRRERRSVDTLRWAERARPAVLEGTA